MSADYINTAAEAAAAGKHAVSPFVEFLLLCAGAVAAALGSAALLWRAARGDELRRYDPAQASQDYQHEVDMEEAGMDLHNGFLDRRHRISFAAWRAKRVAELWEKEWEKILPPDVLAYMNEKVPDPECTYDPVRDGKTAAGCARRFGGTPLPYGGFPGHFGGHRK